MNTTPHRRFFALTILMVVISLLVAPYAYATTSPAPAAPAAVDMSKTYVNPLNLSYMEVASNIRSMADYRRRYSRHNGDVTLSR